MVVANDLEKKILVVLHFHLGAWSNGPCAVSNPHFFIALIHFTYVFDYCSITCYNHEEEGILAGALAGGILKGTASLSDSSSY